MASTRQQIIALLQQKQTATAGELSRALHITAANARHHLSILLSQGVILITGYRPAGERGRPSALYALTQIATQHNLFALTSSLLSEFVNNLPPAQQANALQRIAQRLADNPSTALSPTRRIYRAIERLNHMHYQARWEARADAPRLTLGHCPYAPILDQHPELCMLDCCLISALTGAQAELVERLACTPQGMHECHFILRRQ